MRAYSQDLRDAVIDSYVNNKLSESRILEVFKICKQTLNDWIKRFETTGDYSSKQGVNCGRPVRFSDKEAVLAHIAKNPDDDGIAIRDAVCPELPMTTFYDTMNRMGISCKKKSLNIRSAKKQNAKLL